MKTYFSHESLEIKRQFLSLARNYHEKSRAEDQDAELSLAYELAAALLYMNVADYLAEYLAKGIFELARSGISYFFHGQVTIRPVNIKGLNIGESIKLLKKYSFAQREEILLNLDKVNKARVQVAHQILKVKAEELDKIDQAVTDLAKHSEELVDIIDQIQMGMPPRNMLDILGGQPANE